MCSVEALTTDQFCTIQRSAGELKVECNSCDMRDMQHMSQV